MSILDVSKYKNSNITSILDNKKSLDDRKDTAKIFNNVFTNAGLRLATEEETTLLNHSPSFYLRVNYAESIYISLTSHEIRTLIGSFSVGSSSVPYSVPATIHQVISIFSQCLFHQWHFP